MPGHLPRIAGTSCCGTRGCRVVAVSRTQYYCAMSLDGYIAESDDTIGWLTGYQGTFEGNGAEPMAGTYEQFYEGVGALAMGSATYEFILGELAGGGEWPYKGKPTWVLSSRALTRPGHPEADVRIVAASVRELYDQMMEAAGDGDLWVVGGGDVASQFAQDGLLDEVVVTVVPVVLGSGKPLFAGRLPGGAMRLTRTRTFDNGMVELSYELRRRH
jgi:dihydrofolate reductase